MNHPTPPLKVGFIGCGRVTAIGHLPVLRSLSDIEVVAVADNDNDRVNRVANRFGIKRRYSDFRALLGDPAVEAVAVCVPAPLHFEIALAALEAKKHVFIEKPLALSLDESDHLIERAAHSSRKTMVGFNLRWHRLVRRAREMIQQGFLGPVVLVRDTLTSGKQYQQDFPEWRKRREWGGGEFFETAIHHFDLWRFLLQTEVQEIFASSRSEPWDDETAALTARLANGVLAASVFSTGTSESHEVELYGQHGRLAISLVRFDSLEFCSSSNLQPRLWTPLLKITHILSALAQAALRARQGGDFLDSYRAEWRHFADCIRRDLPVECTLEDGRRALQVSLAAMESASTGKPVKVDRAARKVTPVMASPAAAQLPEAS
jgi:myo-inositol 2-dehydrogenase/D-chiro-inositol 1-dehydrogenase